MLQELAGNRRKDSAIEQSDKVKEAVAELKKQQQVEEEHDEEKQHKHEEEHKREEKK